MKGTLDILYGQMLLAVWSKNFCNSDFKIIQLGSNQLKIYKTVQEAIRLALMKTCLKLGKCEQSCYKYAYK